MSYKAYKVSQKTRQISLLNYSCNSDTQATIPYYKKQIGYDGELKAYLAFQDSGISKYLVKHNQFISFKLWRQTIAKGCDFVFKVGRNIIKIEASTLSKDYNYKPEWFKESRLPRLFNPEYTKKPIHTRKNPFKIIYIWLVNGTEHLRNYEEIKFFATGFGVLLFTISELISYLLSLITVNTVTTASNNYPLQYNTHIVTNSNSNNSNNIILDNNKKREIADLDFDLEIDKAKKLGLYNDYGFSS